MPFSTSEGKCISREFCKNVPGIKVFVDFGAGSGHYGKSMAILRPEVRRIAVEGYYPYIAKYFLGKTYHRVIEANMMEFDRWPEADLAVFGDVIEHLNKPDALEVIKRAKIKYNHIIINLPLGDWPQGAWGGNELERHRSTWTFLELYTLLEDWSIKCEVERKGIFIR
jgi:hypothetical protein